MGIRGLTSLIKKHAPEAMTVYTFNFFKKSIIAIDTSILLYKFRYLSHDNPNCHISGFLNKCLRYISYGIIPVFILDGKPPIAKKEILLKRTNQRKKSIGKLETLNKKLKENHGNIDIHNEIKKLNKQIIHITKEHRDDSRELLEALGFSVIASPGEAESVCAKLQKDGHVNYTFTDDTDALVLGCKKVLRSNSGNANTFVQINLELVLEGLKLTYDEFVDLCILCGCDYCPSIPRVGYLTAYNLILEYKNIENVLEAIKEKYDVPKKYTYQIARDIFKNKETIEKTNNTYKTLNLDEEKLMTFLLERGYKRDYVRNYIKKFKQKVNYCNKVNKV